MRTSSGLAGEAEHHVGAGLGEGFAAADRFLDAAGAPRIGARDDDEVRIGARGQRLLELLHEELGRHQMIDADVVLHPPRQQLVLDLDRREARGFGERDGAMHVHRIAPAAAGVEHERQLAGRARMSTATSAISGSVRLASVTHFTQPSVPPER